MAKSPGTDPARPLSAGLSAAGMAKAEASAKAQIVLNRA